MERSSHPEGPCAQIVCPVGPKYLYRDYFKAQVYTIWVHGPLGALLGHVVCVRVRVHL